MVDVPPPELGGKMPLEHANTPNMDYIAKHGRCELAKTVPDGMPAGSEIANMSILGYAPEKYYTGGPLEAASMGATLREGEIAFRCNLITVADGAIADYSAGHISSEEASVLLKSKEYRLLKERYSNAKNWKFKILASCIHFTVSGIASEDDVILIDKDYGLEQMRNICRYVERLFLIMGEFLLFYGSGLRKTTEKTATLCTLPTALLRRPRPLWLTFFAIIRSPLGRN